MLQRVEGSGRDARPPRRPRQAKLLSALGLQSVLVTDGKNPINLFNTAKGLLGQQE